MLDIYWNILKMHVPINVKSRNNISEWQMGFNSAFKGLTADHRDVALDARSLLKGTLASVTETECGKLRQHQQRLTVSNARV